MITIGITASRARRHAQPWRHICQLRLSHQPARPNAVSALNRAKAASRSDKNNEIPPRLLIYHAGAGRTAFLAMLKLTSVLTGFFLLTLLVPGSVREKPLHTTAAVAACGVVPVLFVAYTTAPFVTHMHIHLPAAARASPASLRRFVAALPPDARLTLTTMSVVATPRCSDVRAADLRRVGPRGRGRLRLANYVRDTAAENARRRWYMYGAVGGFYVQTSASGSASAARYNVGFRAKSARNLVHSWIWDAVQDRIDKRQEGVS
ncbi:hypothetical protein NOR_05758 [Metarhizium rileyi]|uniref:Uncharacterized protein n=1 Tax=Metarhizium rileyi (strain RCEF 4871) TaxID=1649241 RepID=A0A167C1H3_METRR|nr:hypothetical protein NOR_05758 [Metarhizium rileyi RCEF 4871]